MPNRYRYYTVDAFTDKALEGAQIAVLPDASGLSDTQMQLIAREFNLSETVFVLPPMSSENARRLRIFTPQEEVSFGGHPTLATAHVLTSIGDLTAENTSVAAADDTLQFSFEETAGLIRVTVNLDASNRRFCEFGLEASYSVDRFTPPDREMAAMFSLHESDLGIDGYAPMVVATSKPYLVVPVSSFAAVRRAKFDFRAWENSSAPSALSYQALLFSTDTEFVESGYHCRLLGPRIGVNEDLPIGSSMPAFGGYLCEMSGSEHRFAAERGAGKARRSLLHVRVERGSGKTVKCRMGGTAVLVCDGHLHL